MRVLAARFPDRRRASAALDALRRGLALADDDAAIAPLGTPGVGDEGEQTLLAGRFGEWQVEEVHLAVSDAGGLVVADVDEQWTRPRLPDRPKVTQGRHGKHAGGALQTQPVAR